MAETGFDFNKFFADSIQIITNPSEYFSHMNKEGGLGDPILRAVLYGILAGLINLVWGILNIGPSIGWFGGMLGSGVSIITLFMTMIFSVVILFIGGIFILIASALSGGSSDFEASTRVMSSIMVLIPLRALVGVLVALTFYMSTLISLLIFLYAIFLLYKGIVHALNGKKSAARIVTVILAVFPVLILTGSLICVQQVKKMSIEAEKYMKKLPESDRKMKEKFDRLKKKMEEAEKKKQL